MNINQIKYLLPRLVIGLMILIIAGCTEKIVSNDGRGEEVQIVLKWASDDGAMTARPTYLTVTAPDIPQPIIDTLIDNGIALTGVLLVPAGRDRKFVLEVIVPYPGNVGSQVVIYRGETIADIVPGTANKVDIKLFPSAPMLKMTPRYCYFDPLFKTTAVDINVYHMDSLSSLRVNLNAIPSYVYFDSITRGPAFIDDSDFTYWCDGAVAELTILRRSRPDLPIVDNNGYARLATAYIRSIFIDTGLVIDTSWIYINGYDLLKTSGDSISQFYTEGATILISTYYSPWKSNSTKILPKQ
jgi:hypothetical protein